MKVVDNGSSTALPKVNSSGEAVQTEEVVDKETTGRAADAEVAEDGPDEVVKEETSDAPAVNSSAKSIEEDKQEGNDEVDTSSRAKILREEG